MDGEEETPPEEERGYRREQMPRARPGVGLRTLYLPTLRTKEAFYAKRGRVAIERPVCFDMSGGS